MYLYEGDPDAAAAALKDAAEKARAEGKTPGIMTFESPEEAAHDFFKELRRLDSSDADLILALGVEEKGVGTAVMDRMRNAAEGHIIRL